MMIVQNSKISKIVVSAIIKFNDEILLLRRNKDFEEINYGKGLWDLPGGKVEFGIQLNESLRKEMIEEIGFDLLNGKLVHASSYILEYETIVVNQINMFYTFQMLNYHEICLSLEHDKFCFFSKNKLFDLNMIPEVQNYLIHNFKNL